MVGNNKEARKKFSETLEKLVRFAVAYAVLQKWTYVLGIAAFTWGTVVLLGGFASDLCSKDFWTVTALLLLEVARFAAAKYFSRRLSNPTTQKQHHADVVSYTQGQGCRQQKTKQRTPATGQGTPAASQRPSATSKHTRTAGTTSPTDCGSGNSMQSGAAANGSSSSSNLQSSVVVGGSSNGVAVNGAGMVHSTAADAEIVHSTALGASGSDQVVVQVPDINGGTGSNDNAGAIANLQTEKIDRCTPAATTTEINVWVVVALVLVNTAVLCSSMGLSVYRLCFRCDYDKDNTKQSLTVFSSLCVAGAVAGLASMIVLVCARAYLSERGGKPRMWQACFDHVCCRSLTGSVLGVEDFDFLAWS